jgi:hypothetical protein
MTDKECGEKCNWYIKIHDAAVRDNEKLYAENVRLKEAVEAEREACAKVCENGTFLHDFSPEAVYSRACARAIRARGQA